MKRSDVVKLIYKYILHECGDSHEITHQNNSKIDAEAILSLIERIGMLPPTNEEKSFKLLPDGQMTYQVNGWDDE